METFKPSRTSKKSSSSIWHLNWTLKDGDFIMQLLSERIPMWRNSMNKNKCGNRPMEVVDSPRDSKLGSDEVETHTFLLTLEPGNFPLHPAASKECVKNRRQAEMNIYELLTL
ncbi:uncharacterized protein LOC144302289 [Canis aureus]